MLLSGNVLLSQFYEAGDAAHAKDRLDGYNLDGRNISVLYAQVCVDLRSCRCRSCVSLSSLFASADWSESLELGLAILLFLSAANLFGTFFPLPPSPFLRQEKRKLLNNILTIDLDIFARCQPLLRFFFFSFSQSRRKPPEELLSYSYF